MTSATTIVAERALLASGWASNVRVEIADGCIERVATEAPDDPGARADTVAAGVLLPGLVNAHSHAFQRALAGRTERRSPAGHDDFWTWREPMYRLAADINADRLGAIAAQLYAEMLAAGYTTVVEFHYLLGGKTREDDADALLAALTAAANESGIRLVYLPVLYERADFDADLPTEAQSRFAMPIDAFLQHVDFAGRQLTGPHRVGLAAHSLRAVTEASLSRLVDHAKSQHLPLHIHVAEQLREVDDCKRATGKRPVEFLLDTFAVDSDWTLVHATHMNDEETSALAASGAVACLCPSTEGNLGDGLFALESYLADGGRIALGSDSHVCIDPFEELRWLEYGQRLDARRRNVSPAPGEHSGEALLLPALAGGAQAAGQPISGIAVGAPADLLCIDAQHPTLVGHGPASLLDALVFSRTTSAIERVMVDGRWCVEDGRHLHHVEIGSAYHSCMTALFPTGVDA